MPKDVELSMLKFVLPLSEEVDTAQLPRLRPVGVEVDVAAANDDDEHGRDRPEHDQHDELVVLYGFTAEISRAAPRV